MKSQNHSAIPNKVSTKLRYLSCYGLILEIGLTKRTNYFLFVMKVYQNNIEERSLSTLQTRFQI